MISFALEVFQVDLDDALVKCADLILRILLDKKVADVSTSTL